MEVIILKVLIGWGPNWGLSCLCDQQALNTSYLVCRVCVSCRVVCVSCRVCVCCVVLCCVVLCCVVLCCVCACVRACVRASCLPACFSVKGGYICLHINLIALMKVPASYQEFWGVKHWHLRHWCFGTGPCTNTLDTHTCTRAQPGWYTCTARQVHVHS